MPGFSDRGWHSVRPGDREGHGREDRRVDPGGGRRPVRTAGDQRLGSATAGLVGQRQLDRWVRAGGRDAGRGDGRLRQPVRAVRDARRRARAAAAAPRRARHQLLHDPEPLDGVDGAAGRGPGGQVAAPTRPGAAPRPLRGSTALRRMQSGMPGLFATGRRSQATLPSSRLIPVSESAAAERPRRFRWGRGETLTGGSGP